jgi:hypothetical protein
VANAPVRVSVQVHRSHAVAMADTHGVSGGPQGIRLANGTRLNELDAIVLALGHVSARLTPQQERTASLARIHHLAYVTPANPAEVDLSGIAPGEPVLLRGLRELDVVTADGSLVTASPSQNADLFWASRGGLGNFGVVTAMVTDLVPVTRLYGGGLYFSASSTARVLTLYREWGATVPDELSSSFALLRLPPLDVIPEPLRGKFVLHIRIAYTGDAASGEALVRPLREAAPALIDDVREMPYTAVASISNDPEEPGPFVERSALLRSLSPDALDVLLELAGPDADLRCRWLSCGISAALSPGRLPSPARSAFVMPRSRFSLAHSVFPTSSSPRTSSLTGWWRRCRRGGWAVRT